MTRSLHHRDTEAVNVGGTNLKQARNSASDNHYCPIMAAAVLHHLPDDSDWEAVFTKLYRLLRPGA